MPLITYSHMGQKTAALNGVDDNTVLMLHADDYIDSSSHHHPITTAVSIDTNVPKMGTASFHFNNDSFVIQNSTDFNFGTADFTIDFWMKQPSAAHQYLCGGRSSNRWLVALSGTNSSVIGIYHSSLGWPVAVGTTTVTDSLWHHIAIVRYGTFITSVC